MNRVESKQTDNMHNSSEVAALSFGSRIHDEEMIKKDIEVVAMVIAASATTVVNPVSTISTNTTTTSLPRVEEQSTTVAENRVAEDRPTEQPTVADSIDDSQDIPRDIPGSETTSKVPTNTDAVSNIMVEEEQAIVHISSDERASNSKYNIQEVEVIEPSTRHVPSGLSLGERHVDTQADIENKVGVTFYTESVIENHPTQIGSHSTQTEVHSKTNNIHFAKASHYQTLI